MGQRTGLPRVALICDFLEEGWLSMDLTAEMAYHELALRPDYGIHVTQVRPAMRRRAGRVPFLPKTLALNADRLLNRFRDYPRWLGSRLGDFDLFHVMDHSYSQLLHALPRGRSIVTCHDLDTFRCVLDPGRDKRPRWFRAMSQRILEGFREAAHVIAVSGATRDEILSYNLFPAEQISVIPNGVHPAFTSPPSQESIAEIAEVFGISDSRPLLLSVGNTLPRKRLDVLLRVFAAVRPSFPEARLVRVGGLTPELWKQADELGIRESVVDLPFLSRGALAAMYRRASLLLHTADAEGFGLPLIEAMASGCPVLASDIPVLREVGGAAVSYCVVGDIEGWAEQATVLLRESAQPLDWEFRQQQGRARAAGFSWAENARRTALIYRKVLEGK
jgi:glycosyltransferase involved in cell wall biosynthesis